MKCDTAKGIRLQQHGKNPTWTIMILYDFVYIHHWLFITTCWYYIVDCLIIFLLFIAVHSYLYVVQTISNNHHGYQLSRFNWTWSSCIPTSSLRGPPTTKIYSTDFSVPTFSTAGFFHTSKICFWENSTFIANILVVPVSTHSTTSHLTPLDQLF